jgi:hypothetical protein
MRAGDIEERENEKLKMENEKLKLKRSETREPHECGTPASCWMRRSGLPT